MEINCGTAGSTHLILQVFIPILAFTPYPFILKIIGGTLVKWSPPFPTFKQVFVKLSEYFGLKLDYLHAKPGFNPIGGGQIDVRFEPIIDTLKAVEFVERGKLVRCTLYGLTTLQYKEFDAFLHELEGKLNKLLVELDVTCECKTEEILGQPKSCKVKYFHVVLEYENKSILAYELVLDNWKKIKKVLYIYYI